MIALALLMASTVQALAATGETIADHDYRLCLYSWSRVVDAGSNDDVSAIARSVAAHCSAAYSATIAEDTKGAKSMGFISNYDWALDAAISARQNR